VIQKVARDLGVSARGVATRPPGEALRLGPVRIGLWDRYGGATTSGWIRWILERHEFAVERVYPQELDRGKLTDRYDVLILPDEAVPATRAAEPSDPPSEYRHTTGAISRSRTAPQLREFVERGGTLIVIGDATVMADAILGGIVRAPAGTIDGGSGARDTFYVPGSVLRVNVDNRLPLGYGFEREVDVMFESSPVFTVSAEAASVRRVAWFGDEPPLRSGWARGQQHLRGKAAVVEAEVGDGRVLLFGPEITFRGQSHGTFKFLFNGIHLSRARPVAAVE
jgi:hypothetical protein